MSRIGRFNLVVLSGSAKPSASIGQTLGPLGITCVVRMCTCVYTQGEKVKTEESSSFDIMPPKRYPPLTYLSHFLFYKNSGINMMTFFKEFNERTKNISKNVPIQVTLEPLNDRFEENG